MSDPQNERKELDIPEIDKVIHEPSRLSLLAHLYVLDSADALFLKNQVGLTWGNLSSHLAKLEVAGFIEVMKEFVDRKPVTSLRLTAAGREAFRNYRDKMKQLFNDLPP